MTITVIGLYEKPETAKHARKALAGGGFREETIILFEGRADGVVERLAGIGIDEEDGEAFAGAVSKGAAVIALEVEDDRCDAALELLEKNGARAVDAYEEDEESGGGQESRTLKEVEESVEIGKRRIARGGVRAHVRVTERPVEKTVTLQQEHVDVKRRDAGRDLSPEEAEKALKERSVEMTETEEEAKVRKAARQIGEVEITKGTEEHKETVKATARKSEVEVEKVEGGVKSESGKGEGGGRKR